ncbi:MAG: LLM class flavin-dependent oxidoreductase [Rhodobacter sp.]|nr:LLM class flavin-dependent oxidoreductase [Rhodobacter sp.]
MLQGPGCFMNSWRHPSVPLDASRNIDFYVDRARLAEEGGLDFVFIADGLHVHEKSFPHYMNRFEPITILGALAMATKKIGLVATVSTTYADPFTVARQFASLDAISGGRAAWNSVTSPLEGSGRNHSIRHPPHSKRYEIAEEHMEVVTKLWDSWDDDAFLRNRETGQYIDPTKMHRANHEGKFFSVEGPLSVGRSAQGAPLIFQAGSSEAGIRLAGMYADAVFTNGGEFEAGQEFYRRVKESAVAHGRRPEEIKVFPGMGPVVGATKEAAWDKLREISGLLNVEDAMSYLTHIFDQHDFSQYDLDAPFPDIPDAGADGFKSTTAEIKRVSRERGLTLREAAYETATLRAHIGTSESVIGTPEEIADELIRWVDGGAADGFMLGLPILSFGLDDFVKQVLPVLAERGYHEYEKKGTTLRDHFGLPYRESRYAQADQKEALVEEAAAV